MTKYRYPNYRVKSKTSKFHEMTIEQLGEERGKILRKREELIPTPKQLDEARKKWIKTPQRERHERSTQTSFENDEQDWEIEGSGANTKHLNSTRSSITSQSTAEELFNQLYVSLGSIKSGNTSLK